MMVVQRILLVATLLSVSLAAHASELMVLNYHDVVADPGSDRFAVSRATFVAHMDFLQQNGYHPVSLTDLEHSIKTQERLPDKAVLLTFDDGLKSYREFVAPLLEIYEFPSVVSLVTAWLDGIDVPGEYRGKIMSWNDVRHIAKSARVSVISHTHNMHQGIPANVRGNLRGAATTRRYFPVAQRHESETEISARVRADLELSVGRMQQELGFAPEAIAWPYGEYDAVVAQEARTLGMGLQFVLGPVRPNEFHNGMVSRSLIVDRPNIVEFTALLKNVQVIPRRVFVEFNLEPFIGRTEFEQEALLSRVLDRLQAYQANAVIITPVTTDGRRAFFQTDACDLATDVLDRVVHQIHNRLNIRKVVLRIPATLDVSNPLGLFTDLSRLIRFDSLLFEGATRDEYQLIARDIVPKFRAQATFGVEGDVLRAAHDFEFALVAATSVGKTEIDAAKLWVQLGPTEIADQAVDPSGRLPKSGIVNYGYLLDLAPLAKKLFDVNLSAQSGGGGI